MNEINSLRYIIYYKQKLLVLKITKETLLKDNFVYYIGVDLCASEQ